MKITEECINHNLARFVDETTKALYEFQAEKNAFLALAELRGASQLAERLKAVLKE